MNEIWGTLKLSKFFLDSFLSFDQRTQKEEQFAPKKNLKNGKWRENNDVFYFGWFVLAENENSSFFSGFDGFDGFDVDRFNVFTAWTKLKSSYREEKVSMGSLSRLISGSWH